MLKALDVTTLFLQASKELFDLSVRAQQQQADAQGAPDTDTPTALLDPHLEARLIELRARRRALAEVLELDLDSDITSLDLMEVLPDLAVTVTPAPTFPNCWLVRVPRQVPEGDDTTPALTLGGTTFLIYRHWLEQLVNSGQEAIANTIATPATPAIVPSVLSASAIAAQRTNL